MLKIFFFIIVIIHALIHLLGFISAFEISKPNTQAKPISKPMGALWLLLALLLIGFALSYYIDARHWVLIGFISLVLSQGLIITAWEDAKFGTLLNVIILLVLMMA